MFDTRVPLLAVKLKVPPIEVIDELTARLLPAKNVRVPAFERTIPLVVMLPKTASVALKLTELPLTLVDAAWVMPLLTDDTVRLPLLVMFWSDMRPSPFKTTSPPVPVEIVVKAACVIGEKKAVALIVMPLPGPVNPVRTFLTATPAAPLAEMLMLPVVEVETSPVRLTPPAAPPL